ncbi:hypothetical protein GWI33_018999 [Rhynchophorus ferrugineus]|uniref:Uncharacterized protein n=1 Tax=Rhynchophorus ferrugineus TaxID=354439 RepID=A0A834M0W9_RHYFE|nr:hypothetical protein GWI33_018999 [Rhynchophorus ferrugineus]
MGFLDRRDETRRDPRRGWDLVYGRRREKVSALDVLHYLNDSHRFSGKSFSLLPTLKFRDVIFMFNIQNVGILSACVKPGKISLLISNKGSVRALGKLADQKLIQKSNDSRRSVRLGGAFVRWMQFRIFPGENGPRWPTWLGSVPAMEFIKLVSYGPEMYQMIDTM